MPNTITIPGVYELITTAMAINPTFAVGDWTILVPGGTRINTTNLPTVEEAGFPELSLVLTDAEYVDGAVIRFVDLGSDYADVTIRLSARQPVAASAISVTVENSPPITVTVND